MKSQIMLSRFIVSEETPLRSLCFLGVHRPIESLYSTGGWWDGSIYRWTSAALSPRTCADQAAGPGLTPAGGKRGHACRVWCTALRTRQCDWILLPMNYGDFTSPTVSNDQFASVNTEVPLHYPLLSQRDKGKAESSLASLRCCPWSHDRRPRREGTAFEGSFLWGFMSKSFEDVGNNSTFLDNSEWGDITRNCRHIDIPGTPGIDFPVSMFRIVWRSILRRTYIELNNLASVSKSKVSLARLTILFFRERDSDEFQVIDCPVRCGTPADSYRRSDRFPVAMTDYKWQSLGNFLQSARTKVYFSLSSTFASFLALNGQPATIEHRNNPNVDDREKEKLKHTLGFGGAFRSKISEFNSCHMSL
jgi:hypothetical protein